MLFAVRQQKLRDEISMNFQKVILILVLAVGIVFYIGGTYQSKPIDYPALSNITALMIITVNNLSTPHQIGSQIMGNETINNLSTEKFKQIKP